MTPKQRYKEKIKERVKHSNDNEAQGLPADPWVLQYRDKNNSQSKDWRAKKPKEIKPPEIGSYCLKISRFTHL